MPNLSLNPPKRLNSDAQCPTHQRKFRGLWACQAFPGWKCGNVHQFQVLIENADAKDYGSGEAEGFRTSRDPQSPELARFTRTLRRLYFTMYEP